MALIINREKLFGGGHSLLVECMEKVELQLDSDVVLVIVQAGRTDVDQLGLWKKGRTIMGEPPVTASHPLGQVVTQAKTAEQTAHGFRRSPEGRRFCAFDWMVRINGKFVRADSPPDLQALAEEQVRRWQAIARTVPGIALGQDFPLQPRAPGLPPFAADPPHVQVAAWRSWPYAPNP